jgi:hypothetical protein
MMVRRVGWILILLALVGPPAATAAQEATPAPTAAATPVAAWTPVPLPAPGEPADPETTARVLAWVDEWFGFWTTGDAEGHVAHVTDNYLHTVLRVETPAEALTVFEEAPPAVVRTMVASMGNVRIHPDGHLSVDLVTLFGGHFVRHLRDYLIEEDGVLKLDVVEALPPEPPVGERVEVELLTTDGAFVPSEIRLPATDVIGLKVRNAGMQTHDLFIARLPEGYDPARLLTEDLPAEALSLGGTYDLASGQQDTVYLVGLEPGVYTIVCTKSGRDDISHIATGEVAQLIVE